MPCNPHKPPGRSRSLLILGRIFYKGLFNVDGQLKTLLNAEGYQLGFGLYQEMTWERLRKFDALICLAQPRPKTEAYDAFLARLPLFHRFITEGGGVLILHDVTSGGAHEERALNHLLETMQARILDEEIIERDPECIYRWTEHYSALRAKPSEEHHPILEGVSELWVSRHTQPIVVDKQWACLAYGSPTTYSRPIQNQNTSATYPETPLLIAARSWRKGRVALYPTVASFSILEGFHPRWKGFLFEQGDGMRFFKNMFAWLCDGPVGGILGGFDEGEQDFIFPSARLDEFRNVREVPKADQGRYGRPQKTLIGVECKPTEVVEWAGKARSCGYAAIILTANTFYEYRELEQVAVPIDNLHSRVLVALDMEDARGNKGLIFGGALSSMGWPLGSRPPSFLDQCVRIGGFSAWTHADQNPWPPRIVGSIAGVEVKHYVNQTCVRDAEDLYLDLNRYDWYLAPLVIQRLDTPDQLIGCKGYDFYLMAESAETLEHPVYATHVPGVYPRFQPLSSLLFPSFISNGPLIEAFHWRGPGLYYDVWEGEYYQWVDPWDVAEIVIRIVSEVSLHEVRLYEDDRLLRRYPASGKRFDLVFEKITDNGGHSYRLEVDDDQGGRALSSVLRSRSIYFWAHGGGDRRNTYANLFYPDEQGNIRMGGRSYSGLYCLPEFDTGWRNAIASRRPPIPSHLIAARGIEAGSLPGGLSRVVQPPFLDFVVEREGGWKGANHAADIGRSGYEHATRDVAILEDKKLAGVLIKTEDEQIIPQAPRKFDLRTRYTSFRVLSMSYSATLVESELDYNHNALAGIETVACLTVPYDSQAQDFLTTGAVVSANVPSVVQAMDFSVEGSIADIPLKGPGYAAVWPHPRGGNLGLYVLDANRYVVTFRGDPPAISIALEVPRNGPQKGTLHTRILWVYTTGQEEDPSEYFHRIAEAYGLAGTKPEWNLEVENGEVLEQGFPVVIDTSCHGVTVKLNKVKIPNVFAVRVQNINPNWSAGILDWQTDILDHLPVCGRDLFIVLPTPTQAQTPVNHSNFYAGNFVTCNHSEVRLDLLSRGKDGSLHCKLHNPTTLSRDIILSSPLLNGTSTECHLNPGEEKQVSLVQKLLSKIS